MRNPLMACLVLAFLVPAAPPANAASQSELETMAASADALARIARRLGGPGVADDDLADRIGRDHPDVLLPFAGYHVIVRGGGAVLICTSDGRYGLVEDYACTPQVDVRLFDLPSAPCAFTMSPTAACSQSGGP